MDLKGYSDFDVPYVSCEKTGRYEYFHKYYGSRNKADRQTVTGILIGDTNKYPETLESLKSVVNNGIFNLPTIEIEPLNNILTENESKTHKGWVFIMLVGEVLDEVMAIALKHYINTVDYDAWNIYVVGRPYRASLKQTRLFKFYARFENGNIKNILCVGAALNGCIKKVKSVRSY